MPFWDRLWWLRPLGALLAAVFGALIVARLAVPDVAAGRFSSDTWIALALGVGFLAVAVVLATSTAPARDRKERRERALAGDPHAIPRALLPRSEERGKRVSRVRRPLPRPPRMPPGRLAVSWRAGWFDRLYAGFLTLVGLVCLITSVAVLVPFARFLLTGEPRSVLRVTLAAFALLIVAFCPFSLYLLYWAIPALLGRRPAVEVTRDAIATRQLWGRQQTVRWEDARLLEISAPRRFGLMAPHRTFRLYGSRSVAVWRDELRPFSDYRLDLFEPDRPYRFQVRERMDALLDLVMKRTSLAPRTFSPSLAGPPHAALDASRVDASRVEREAPVPRDADDA